VPIHRLQAIERVPEIDLLVSVHFLDLSVGTPIAL
jgi:hypothetical protein